MNRAHGARLMVTFSRTMATLRENPSHLLKGGTTAITWVPVDVAQLPDGSLLVSDDLVGALYRIWYDGK